MGKQRSNIDPKGISMCTNCRHMVQTREMRFAKLENKMLCPMCYAEFNKGQLIAKALVEEKIESNLGSEMKKLRDKLKKKGLM